MDTSASGRLSPARALTPLRAVLVLVTLAAALLATLPSAPALAGQGPAGLHKLDFPVVPPQCQSSTEVPKEPCRVTRYGAHAPTVIVWGDSHAWMYLGAMKKAAQRTHTNLIAFLTGGCPPAVAPPDRGKGYTECEDRDAATLDYVTSMAARKPHLRVVLGDFWLGYRDYYSQLRHDRDSLSQYFRRIARLGYLGTPKLMKVLGRHHIATDVIGQNGVTLTAPDCADGDDPYQCPLPRSRTFPQRAAIQRYLHRIMKPLPKGARLIDTSSSYCDATTCYPQEDGVDTWFDSRHLGATFTRNLASYFVPSFRAAARTTSPSHR